MKSIVSNKDDKELLKENLRNSKHNHKIKKNKNIDDDMVVISRDGFDEAFNSYDWIVNENFNEKHDDEYQKTYDNYRQLSRYEDILKIINDDKFHANNLSNFEKYNDKFYNSMKDQIFDETLRIIDNNVEKENYDDYGELDNAYKTLIRDTDKIIKIVSDKDKSFLDLIYTKEKNDEEWEHNENRPKNSRHNREDRHFTNRDRNRLIEKEEINSIKTQPLDDDVFYFKPNKNENEDSVVNEVFSRHEKPNNDKTPVINGSNPANNNFSSNENNQSPINKQPVELFDEYVGAKESENEFVTPPVKPKPGQPTTSVQPNEKFLNQNPYTYESEIKRSDINNIWNNIKETQPKLSPEQIEENRRKELQRQIDQIEKPVLNNEVVKPKSYDHFNVKETPKSKADDIVLPPSSNLENSEYNKLKKMINHYNNNSDILTMGSSSPIGIADSLKVNLNKGFYLDSNELFEAKRQQNEKIDNILKEYEKIVGDNKSYEAKKEIENLKKQLEAPVVDNTNLKNKVDELAKINNENVKIRNENIQLKNKIKELEYKMRQNLVYQKSIINEKEDVKKSLLESKEKKLGVKESIVTQFINSSEPNNLPKVSRHESSSSENPSLANSTKLIDSSKPVTNLDKKDASNLDNKQPTVKEIHDKTKDNKQQIDELIGNTLSQIDVMKNNDIPNKPVVSNEKNKENILAVQNNTLANLKKTASDNFDDDEEDMRIADAVKNKPFSFKQVDDLDNTNRNVPPTSKRILESNSGKITPLNEAYNQKKQELFKSFNLDQNPVARPQQPQQLSNSQRIIKNRINNDDSEIKFVSLKEALSKKKRGI